MSSHTATELCGHCRTTLAALLLARGPARASPALPSGRWGRHARYFQPWHQPCPEEQQVLLGTFGQVVPRSPPSPADSRPGILKGPLGLKLALAGLKVWQGTNSLSCFQMHRQFREALVSKINWTSLPRTLPSCVSPRPLTGTGSPVVAPRAFVCPGGLWPHITTCVSCPCSASSSNFQVMD